MEEPQPKYTSPRGMWISKLILRIFSIIFCITLAALGGAMANTHIVDALIFLVMGPPVFAALAWDIAEGICILIRGGHRGIHPGACVGVDLILWLALVACTTLLGLIGLGTASSLYYYTSYYYDYYDLGYDSSLYSDVILKGRAVLGLAGCLILIHFVLFVIACYETNVRNHMGPTIVYVTGPAPTGTITQTTSMYGVPQGMVQQPQQVYYQTQPVGGTQMPMYYTYPQPTQQQQQVPVSPTSTSPSPQNYSIQPVASPPPIYSGNKATENKTELP